MNVFITGTSGQIGANLALKLMEQGHRVMGVDIRDNEWTDQIPDIRMDLRTECSEKLAGILRDEGCEVVVHLAAHAKVFELVENPSRALENVQILFHTLEASRQAGLLPFIFGSSREVYGDIHHHVTDESCADFVIAESPYSASKISGEAFIYSYSQCYGLPHLVFRFSNVYGRFDNDLERMVRVMPLFIDELSKGRPITIFGPEKVLDFTYVDDCVDGIIAGITNMVSGKVKNETINLAYGKGNSLEKMALIIADTLGVKPDIIFEPTQPGEVTHYVADITKARNLLGYNPEISLEEGIPKSIAWAQEFNAQVAR
jgi:UDP-glucuronate 4-epimerase